MKGEGSRREIRRPEERVSVVGRGERSSSPRSDEEGGGWPAKETAEDAVERGEGRGKKLGMGSREGVRGRGRIVGGERGDGGSTLAGRIRRGTSEEEKIVRFVFLVRLDLAKRVWRGKKP